MEPETVSVDPATATPQQVLEATLRLAAACARLPVPGSGAACMERAALLGDVADAVEVALAPLVERIDSCGEARTHGFTGTGAWLATGLGTRTAVAADRLALARTLRRLPEVAGRFEDHRLPAGYAAAVCRAVKHLDDADTAKAERILLGLAESGGTVEQVRRAGERIVETVRGDGPDGDTRKGYDASWLEVTGSLDGGVWVKGWLDPELGQLLQSKLDPLTSRSTAAGTRDRRTAAALRTFLTRDGHGQEAVAVIRLRTTGDPSRNSADPEGDAGGRGEDAGLPPQAPGGRPRPGTVSFPRPSIRAGRASAHGTGPPPGDAPTIGGGPGAGRWGIERAHLADGTPISAAQAKRIALNHGMSVLLLDGEGRPIRLGDRVRFASRAQRLALAALYTACVVDECDIPSRACEVDHVTGWELGGPTDIGNLVPVCGFHNRHKADHPGSYEIARGPDGRMVYRILRPPWMRKHAA
ncbi:HNH endonuclease signature motif containing protein [Rhizohabitans arisaemae]|uniref:HNH endonuclease signature motif containing protein n=1 Tax=Rhizohabitans arisaemae TaxID=2720610 RepID=UPI0024B1ED8B|nr:HNH endonuclease signature motif containing protein [Rhizohabitans arisaemae]